MLIQTTGFTEGSFPFRYLKGPISSARLNKMECQQLVDKITARVRVCRSRHFSYAGRVMLITSVLMGIIEFWNRNFILTKIVITEVESICRNYLWGE